MLFIVLCVIGYLVGSIPSGKIVAFLKGVDIQRLGTGNIGASNTYLILGKRAALIVLISDLGKAYIMMHISLYYLSLAQAFVVGLFLLLGNLKSIFLKFTGGKGVATMLGIFLAAEPAAAFVLMLFWGVALIFIKYIMVMAVIGSLFVPITFYSYNHEWVILASSFLMCLMVLLKHRSNLKLKVRNPEIQKLSS